MFLYKNYSHHLFNIFVFFDEHQPVGHISGTTLIFFNIIAYIVSKKVSSVVKRAGYLDLNLDLDGTKCVGCE